jgi:predicted metalloprotease
MTGIALQPQADASTPRPLGVITRRMALLAATILVLLGLVAAVSTSPAQAMTPRQTTLKGTVDLLWYDLDSFWRFALGNSSYRSPTIGYYTTYGTAGAYVAACGGYLYDYTIMAECPNNGNPQIWIHTGVNQDKINRLGDYAAGFFLAHEFGHHIANVLGLRFSTIRGRELYADCMAGVFTRYALTQSYRLDNSDYWEGMASLDDRFPNEGGANGYPLKADRKNWYWYGYSNYSLATCGQAVNQ